MVLSGGLTISFFCLAILTYRIIFQYAYLNSYINKLPLHLRILNELVTIRDDMERQKRDAESFLSNQLQKMQQKNSRELQKHMQTG